MIYSQLQSNWTFNTCQDCEKYLSLVSSDFVHLLCHSFTINRKNRHLLFFYKPYQYKSLYGLDTYWGISHCIICGFTFLWFGGLHTYNVDMRTLDQSCCKKWQKSPGQETSLANRRRLKVLNDTKLIRND